MARYARVENGVAVELIDTGDYAIDQLFAPSFVASMVQVSERADIEIGAPISQVQHNIEPQHIPQSPVIPQLPIVESEGPQASERIWRQSSLSATEWLVTRHRDEQELGRGTSLKASQYLELLEFRQTLRDWPDSSCFPAVASRPSRPEWIDFSGDK